MVQVRRSCSYPSCDKFDAGGGLCVSHGGGKKCRFEGCANGYQRGGYCRKHGGGSRCTVPGCNKVDAGGGLCRGHGGGKRCTIDGCQKADVGGGFCTMHGGGKRCGYTGCQKNSQGGGFCRAHGGGKRCTEPDCTKMGRGANGKCPDHGGPAMCRAPNCRRIARGTNGYCLEHQNENIQPGMDQSLTPLLHPQDPLPPIEPIENVMFSAPQTSSLPKMNTIATITSAPMSSYIYRRLLLQLPQQTVWKEDACLAVLRTLPCVRSVHILGFRHGVTRQNASVCFILRGSMTATDIQRLLTPLNCPYVVLEEAEIDNVIVTLEWIFHVEGMMCMGNCGTTVLNAIRAMPHVQRAQIDFEKRHLIVHSIDGNTTSFLQCIEGIGFSATKISMMPLPPRVRYSVSLVHGTLITYGQTGVILKSVLEHIEGVEKIVLLLDQTPSEVILIGMFDANEVAVITTTYGIQLSPILSKKHSDSLSRRKTSLDEEEHICDFGCGENGCPKYRTTMAHTAALAVGWSVPGCGMTFGRECTCGDACRCVGCPEHNPDFGPAPRWRQVRVGLNIHGICTNPNCVTRGRNVIVPQGIRPFSLFSHACDCPMCNGVIQATSCGFYSCEWRFEGILNASQMHVSSPWHKAVGEKYFVMSEAAGDVTTWSTLVVTTKYISEKEECYVCYEALTNTETKLLSKCRHKFHKKCLSTWARTCQRKNLSLSCPTCRVVFAL
ncbi:hypothetical protein THRCLA_04696 [Thraustotheca clavata]|uniref:RING-type domain-containing protein n=1 Tax=Thraustotheca clavata TaxID=74557 RepID=A0A1V9ZY77_9STRA|nr:hypothetical protein THRCLA_04696 [Thraustotheca clavata]